MSDQGNVLDHVNFPKLHMLHKYCSNIMDLGAADNFGTDVTESMHRFFCHQTFEATNKRDYKPQMVKNLNQQEALHTASHFYCWRQNLWLNHDSDNDDEIEGTTHSATRGVHLSKHSHATANLADIVSALGLNRLPGAIQRYIC